MCGGLLLRANPKTWCLALSEAISSLADPQIDCCINSFVNKTSKPLPAKLLCPLRTSSSRAISKLSRHLPRRQFDSSEQFLGNISSASPPHSLSLTHSTVYSAGYSNCPFFSTSSPIPCSPPSVQERTLLDKYPSSTLSWSASFYPQPLLNISRRSTHGTTPAFPTLNVLGFLCYTTSTLLFYYSPLIQSQYRTRNNGEDNTVRANDVAFAMHALVLCVLTWSQFWTYLWGFERRKVRLGKGVWGIVVGCVIGVAWVVGMVKKKGLDGGNDAYSWAWIDVVSFSWHLRQLF